MADDDDPGGPPGGGGKKIAGIPQTYLIVGAVALAGGLAWMWWERTHAKAGSASASTTVITGSVSSNTGISGSMLNAILKDWQEHPTSSTSTGSGGDGGKKTTKTSTTGTGGKKTTKTSTTGTGGKKPPPKKSGGQEKQKTTRTVTKKRPPISRKITPDKITGYKEITVKAGQTLDEIAKEYGITPAELASQNVYVKGEVPGDKKVGQTLGTGAGLKTGQTLRVPIYGK